MTLIVLCFTDAKMCDSKKPSQQSKFLRKSVNLRSGLETEKAAKGQEFKFQFNSDSAKDDGEKELKNLEKLKI